MDQILQDAVMKHLTRVPVRRVDVVTPIISHERDEYARLRGLRESGQWRPLAARLSILVTLGWKRTEIAEAMDVSRVTLNNWLRQHTRGEDTFTPYGPTPLEGDLDAFAKDIVNEEVLNKLPDRKGEQLAGLKFTPDRFVVPAGFRGPLDALWRIAYRARGAEATKDDDVAAASDALDILISIMLRRGVTNLAIAEAAGVTHRAVLDRMNRARARGIVMTCDLPGGCESFHGERDLINMWDPERDPGNVDFDDWLNNTPPLKTPDVLLAAVRATSTRPSRYWLQTLTEDDGLPVTVPMTPHPKTHTRMHVAQLGCWDDDTVFNLVAHVGELWTAAMLGRTHDDSLPPSLEDFRSRLMFVPLSLLYTESSERAGHLPATPLDAVDHVPRGLWTTYFAKSELVKDCFLKTDTVLDSYESTTKHPADARTRISARA